MLIGRCGGDGRVCAEMGESTYVKVCRASAIPIVPKRRVCYAERVFDARGASVLLHLRAECRARDGALRCLLLQKGECWCGCIENL